MGCVCRRRNGRAWLLDNDGGNDAEFLVSGVASARGSADADIGFTLVAFGTSLPEPVTAIQAQHRRESDLLVGNLLGSNLFNSLIGGAIVGLFAPSDTTGIAYPAVAAMVGISLAWLLLFRGHRVNRIEAGVLIAHTPVPSPCCAAQGHEGVVGLSTVDRALPARTAGRLFELHVDGNRCRRGWQTNSRRSWARRCERG